MHDIFVNRASNILEQIAELKDSGTVLVAYHANDPGAGMAQNKDLERFKLYTADIGLFVTLVFKDSDLNNAKDYDLYKRLCQGWRTYLHTGLYGTVLIISLKKS